MLNDGHKIAVAEHVVNDDTPGLGLLENEDGRCHTNLDRRGAGFERPLNFRPRWGSPRPESFVS